MEECESAWMNECEGWLALGNVSRSIYHIEKQDGLICAWWVYPFETHNHCILVPPGTASQDVLVGLAGLRERLESSKCAAEIRIVSKTGIAGELLVGLQRSGFAYSGSDPIMTCPIRNLKPPSPSEAVIHKAVTRDRYIEVLETFDSVFGGPRYLTHFFNPEEVIQFYYASLNGKLVSAAAVWSFSGVKGFYSVSTLRPYRGRGYASQLIRHVLYENAAGDTLAALRTTDKLVPFYEKLGFQETGRMYRFIRQKRKKRFW